MTTTVVVVPDIGDFEDIPVIEILVAPGDAVAAEQPLITLESDKATMDVPAPQAGVIGRINVSLGDNVREGSALLELVVATPDTTTDVGAKKTPAVIPVDNVPPATQHEPSALPVPPQPAKPSVAGTKGPHATPAIRRFARTVGVDLTEVTGTGNKGRILRSDVEAHIRERLTHSAAGGIGIPRIPAVDFSKFGPVETQPLSRIKRISGPFLHRAWLNVPHVTYNDEADITELEAFRERLKNDPATSETRITPLAFIVKVLCLALKKFPMFNASLSPDGESLILKQYFNIGVAVDTPGGLVVPVIRDVDGKGITAIANELSQLFVRARDGKLKVNEIEGGCISISSLGGIGGTAFTPLVNAPEVAILGIARSRMTPMWSGTEFEPRLMLPLCLSFDHRVADGAEAARFMSFLCMQLSDLRKLLL